MAIWTGREHTSEVIAAASIWRQNCLETDGSLFSSEKLWTKSNLESLKAAFVDNPLLGPGTFLEKLTNQLSQASQSTQKLASECLWLLLLFIARNHYSEELKKERISAIWNLSGEKLSDSNFLSDQVLEGLGAPGTAFITGQPDELAFLITLLLAWKSLDEAKRSALLNEPWKFCTWVTSTPGGDRRAFRHMLIFFVFPEYFERCCSWNHKRLILEKFGKLPPESNHTEPQALTEIDRSIYNLRTELEVEFGTKELDFYLPPLREAWRDAGDEEGPLQTSSRQPQVWIEKTIVKNSPSRLKGEDALGRALWSPQRSKSNGDIYANMRQVRVGDIILHLVNNEGIAGASIAASSADDTFIGIDGTDWSGQPCYRIALRDYVAIQPPLLREDFFHIEPFATRLRELANGRVKGLFYTADLTLNQGAYLTAAPPQLFLVLRDAYKNACGKALPYIENLSDGDKSIETQAETSESQMVRDCALKNYIEPARKRGELEVSIKSSDIHSQLGLNNSFPTVCQALRGKKFQVEAGVPAPKIYGKDPSSTTVFSYSLTPEAELHNAVNSHDVLQDVFLESDELDSLMVLWKERTNIILQGPPGVGKSYTARRIAELMVESTDPSRISFVQFHQSYSYEDFVQGFRPQGEGFFLRDGKFLEFCKRAQKEPDRKYVFIIDEINRGNLSKILGELMLLIESDKRDIRWQIELPYGEQKFFVPKNVFILGLMNTADRSLAVVDYALRRRFAFATLQPKMGSEKFRSHLLASGVNPEIATLLLDRIKKLNLEIEEDVVNLGPGFAIGHSFFCKGPGETEDSVQWYRRIIKSEIAPLLQEYWFDDAKKVRALEEQLLAGL